VKKALGILASLVAASPCAYAQSSVTLFGLIDAGVSYVSNEGGSKNVKFDDGVYTPNLWGFVGREDLGGGTRAVFRLVNQFSLGNGQLIGGGIFSRDAWVGLDNDRYGRITLGNQHDFMVDSLFSVGTEIAMDLSGYYGFRNGPFTKLALPGNPTGALDWDRTGASFAIPNSVKYVTPSFAGFSFGTLYGFGNVAGSIGANNAVSFGASYDGGAFAAGAAYTNIKFGPSSGVPGTSVRNWGVGMRYTYGRLTWKELLTTVHNSFNGASIWMIESGGVWMLAPDLFTGASYTYMKGNESVDNNHAHQISAALGYLLSKRTTVYVSSVYQRASSGGHALINGIFDANGASSNENQAIVRAGLNIKF